MNISEHITYKEATSSITAKRNGVPNDPNEAQLKNMKIWAEKVFEPLRAHFGKPISVASLFRSKPLNELVGGATRSQHMALNGAAGDLDNEDPSNREMFDYIRENLEFDQLIFEYGTEVDPAWVHVSYNEGKNRKEVLRCRKERPKYIKYE